MTDRRRWDRPKRLAAACCLVVWGAERITLAEATVWYHDWLLDYLESPDGSYMSAKSMSERLRGKVSDRTVELARTRLRSLGLYLLFKREGCRQYGRICTMPPACIPKSNKDAQDKARLLDHHIDLVEHGSTVKEPRRLADRTEGYGVVEPNGRRASDSSIADEGGKGGEVVLCSHSLPERQLFSAVVVKENREVAHDLDENRAAFKEKLRNV